MGLVIEAPRFTAEDVAAFGERLQPEQTPLEGWSAAGPVPRGPRRGGFELEAWLVGPDLRPAPCPASRRPWSPVGGAVLASASDSPGSASCPRWRPSISLWPTGSHADVSGHATPHLPTPRRSRPLTFQIPGYNRPFMKNGDVAVEATATTIRYNRPFMKNGDVAVEATAPPCRSIWRWTSTRRRSSGRGDTARGIAPVSMRASLSFLLEKNAACTAAIEQFEVLLDIILGVLEDLVHERVELAVICIACVGLHP